MLFVLMGFLSPLLTNDEKKNGISLSLFLSPKEEEEEEEEEENFINIINTLENPCQRG